MSIEKQKTLQTLISSLLTIQCIEKIFFFHVTKYVEIVEKPEEANLKTTISSPRDYCLHFGIASENLFAEFAFKTLCQRYHKRLKISDFVQIR